MNQEPPTQFKKRVIELVDQTSDYQMSIKQAAEEYDVEINEFMALYPIGYYNHCCAIIHSSKVEHWNSEDEWEF